jgi:glc operon protein GlcG
MQDARPIGIELAIGKARSAALFQEPTQALEAAINSGRPAAITAARIQMQGGVPIRMSGAVIGAVGVSGFDKANDVAIAEAAAAAVK